MVGWWWWWWNISGGNFRRWLVLRGNQKNNPWFFCRRFSLRELGVKSIFEWTFPSSLSIVTSKHGILSPFSWFYFLAHSFPSFPVASSLFDLVNISSHDLMSPFFRPRSALLCALIVVVAGLFFFFPCPYFSFIMVILRFSALPLAACFLLKHHIHGRDEPLPHRPECKFNIAFSLLSDVHNLSQYLLPWGMRICLFDKFSAQVDFAAAFFRHANGTRQFGTNKFILLLMINTRFSCFKPFQAHLNISGTHLRLF